MCFDAKKIMGTNEEGTIPGRSGQVSWGREGVKNAEIVPTVNQHDKPKIELALRNSDSKSVHVTLATQSDLIELLKERIAAQEIPLQAF